MAGNRWHWLALRVQLVRHELKKYRVLLDWLIQLGENMLHTLSIDLKVMQYRQQKPVGAQLPAC